MELLQMIAEAVCWMVLVLVVIGVVALLAAIGFIIWLEIRDMMRDEEDGK